jgi:putative tricarboxylic transport membrane protein
VAALRRDLACAAFGWGLAATMWFAAARLPRSMLSDAFGADGLPRLLAGGLAIVATLIAVRAILANRRTANAQAADAGLPMAAHARATGIVVLGFAYVALAPLAGYLATAFALLVATAIYYGARASATLALVSAGGALVLWATFAKLLGVSMPAGVWLSSLGALFA